jgi:hypothetical protein
MRSARDGTARSFPGKPLRYLDFHGWANDPARCRARDFDLEKGADPHLRPVAGGDPTPGRIVRPAVKIEISGL